MDLERTIDPPLGTEQEPPATKKVLVIDDSHVIVDLVRNAIEMHGNYEVIVAYDGVEGLEQYQRVQPDCVIVDVMMPRMDGFQLVRCLRGDAKSSSTPLIILTALVSPEKELTGFLSGADEYLTKPFKTSVLCETLDRVLMLTPDEREERLKRLADGGLK